MERFWKLIRFAGIDVDVHVTFFILIARIGLSSGWRERSGQRF